MEFVRFLFLHQKKERLVTSGVGAPERSSNQKTGLNRNRHCSILLLPLTSGPARFNGYGLPDTLFWTCPCCCVWDDEGRQLINLIWAQF
jgi:hypothetical protein